MPGASPTERPPTLLRTPAERTPRVRPALPAPLTPLLGREREIAQVRALLDGDATRLLTLTGPGGVGKSRVALEVATQVQGDFAHGACFIPLASIRDPNLVASAVAQALGVQEIESRPIADVLAAALHAQHLLLILDNMEQVVVVAPWLAELLSACPRVKVLVTSRILLRIRGEHSFPVPPLLVPDADRQQPAEAMSRFAAMDLFTQRARVVRPDFALTEANAGVVAEICRRLDGLPLAIELAAARVNVLSPAAILARMTNRLTLLTGSRPDVPVRLQTMRNAVAWSYELLSPDEQAFFRRLAIFTAGFTLDAAEAIEGGGDGDSVQGDARGGDPSAHEPTPSVLDRMASLIDQSLIQPVHTVQGEPRFGMLETIREYGLDQLATTSELNQVASRHAAYALTLAEQAAPHLTGAEQAAWLNRLEAAHSDLRAAFAWLNQHGDPDLSLRLATALWRFGYTRGYLSETRDRLDQALARSPAPVGSRAEALNGAGLLASTQGDLGIASARHEEALDLCRALGDHRGVAVALNGLGDVAAAEGNHSLAIERYEAAMQLFRDIGDRRGVAGVLTNLGNLYWGARDLSQARALHEQASDLYQVIGERRGLAWSASNLGTLAAEQGDLSAGATWLGDALALYQDLGDQSGIVATLEGFAELARARGQRERETMLFAAAAATREAIGVPVPAVDRARYESTLSVLRNQLGASFRTIWAAGQAMTPDEAVTTAVATATSPVDQASVTSTVPPTSHGLSQRELEVLKLIADGLTNKEIGDALFVSHRTVTSHASNILGKLGLTSRTAAVSYAIRNRLA